MGKNLIICIGIILGVGSMQAQQFSIKGILQEQQKKVPLEAATVFIENYETKELITYTITDKNGHFELEGKTTQKTIRFYVSFIGYRKVERKIEFKKERDLDLGTIELQPEVEALEDVIIKSNAPVTIKKDTLEFNAASFKLHKNATVEDLLKELPGVEVNDDGSIKVNGKDVNKILVNGKTFFGNDPTITTRNLTKDIIEKIQVSDTKSESEAFTGQKGSTKEKTINITLKKDRNRGYFGRIGGGIGNRDRYEFSSLANVFDEDRRFSLLAGGNNINSPGFSFSEIQKMFGSSANSYFNGNAGRNAATGITVSKNTGAHYADEYKGKVSITTDYFYSDADNDDKSITERENILTDTRFFTNNTKQSTDNTDTHKVDLKLDIEVNPTFLINLKPSFNKVDYERRVVQQEDTKNENKELSNRTYFDRTTDTEEINFKNTADFTKKIGDKGSFFKVNIANEYDQRRLERLQNSDIETFGDAGEKNTQNQKARGKEILRDLKTTFSYRLPLIQEKLFLDFKYNYEANKTTNSESTFDFDQTTADFSQFNSELSTDFSLDSKTNKGLLQLSYKGNKLSMSAHGAYANRNLKSKDKLRSLKLQQQFNVIEWGTDFEYQFNTKTSMFFGYDLSNNPPRLEQLQPITDVSNPLNRIAGNPDLKPANEHALFFGINSYNYQTGSGVYSYGNINITNDKIITKTTIDANLLSTTTYDNIDGDYSAYGSFYYSKALKLDAVRRLRFRTGMTTNLSRRVNFFNSEKYASKKWSVGPSVSMVFRWKKAFEFRTNYRMSYTTNRYNIETLENRKFVSHRVGIKTTTFAPKNLEWRNTINYQYNPNIAEQFQRSAWFWNTTIAYTFLKNKAVATLKIYDVLNQNTNASRTATANYIEDIQNTVLKQYFMLNFSYKFNSMGSKRTL